MILFLRLSTAGRGPQDEVVPPTSILTPRDVILTLGCRYRDDPDFEGGSENVKPRFYPERVL
jgi:hypothetical protein